jgi:hypothetical protein
VLLSNPLAQHESVLGADRNDQGGTQRETGCESGTEHGLECAGAEEMIPFKLSSAD